MNKVSIFFATYTTENCEVDRETRQSRQSTNRPTLNPSLSEQKNQN